MGLVDDAADIWERVDEIALRSRPALPKRTDGRIDCQDCGEEIPEARRLAVPACPRCVDCQEAADRRHP